MPNIDVVPFAIEAHGRLGESAIRLIRSIAPIGARERAEAIGTLYQNISSLLQRTQADAIITATRGL